MEIQTFVSERAGETCYLIEHPSGLPIYVCPKPGYRTSYAVFATRYGSVDTMVNGREVPAGIAHYLEHKLFDSGEGSVFDRYAATGASANAYTSFDHTAYLFTCSGPLEQPLSILLDFVQSPYFTDETVEKERGIIGQEIRMCEDTPNRRVRFNLLRALYREHPVNIDIAGTVESIADITPELLYGCYRAFYHPRNMVLAVAGDVTPERVIAAVRSAIRDDGPRPQARAIPGEPDEVAQPFIEAAMTVSAPLFYLGYKDTVAAGAYCTPERLAAADVLLDVLAGKASPLYARLMERELINESFGTEYFEGPGYAAWLFGGESRDPQAVRDAVREEIARLRRDGIGAGAFEAAKRSLYGRLIAGLNDVENCGDRVVRDAIYGRKPFELLDAAAVLDIQSVYDCLQNGLREDREALSVVRPKD